MTGRLSFRVFLSYINYFNVFPDIFQDYYTLPQNQTAELIKILIPKSHFSY